MPPVLKQIYFLKNQPSNQTKSSMNTTSNRTGAATNAKAWVAKAAKQSMVLEAVDLGPFAAEDVEIAVENCGICHSDLSVLNNDWGISQYPATLGHEVIGRITAAAQAPRDSRSASACRRRLQFSGSCMHRHQCMSTAVITFASRPGQATHRRSSRRIREPRPLALGLGHPAAGKIELRRSRPAPVRRHHRLLAARHARDAHRSRRRHRHRRTRPHGREIYCRRSCRFAMSLRSPRAKANSTEAKGFGANHVASGKDSAAIKKLAGSFTTSSSTPSTALPLDWDAMIGTLAPRWPGCTSSVPSLEAPSPFLPSRSSLASAASSGSRDRLAGHIDPEGCSTLLHGIMSHRRPSIIR